MSEKKPAKRWRFRKKSYICRTQVKAIDHIVTTHSLDYERLWMTFKRTIKWILQRLASNQPLQTDEYRKSTIYSALKRLQKDGYVIYSDRYGWEKPFFKDWNITNNNLEFLFFIGFLLSIFAKS